MALVEPEDFREGTLAEYCSGLALTEDLAGDDQLEASIARVTARVSDWCNDTFEGFTVARDDPPDDAYVTVDGRGTASLILPHRTRSITSLTLVGEDGTTEVEQDDGVWRLHSSLNAAGDATVDDFDWIDVVSYAGGLTHATSYGHPYCWPNGVGTVRIAGTFGWATPPADVKRAIAILVWAQFKPVRAEMLGASGYTTGDISVNVAPIDSDHPSGIREVDQIVVSLRRDVRLGVG